MYEVERARLEELRTRFDRAAAGRAPGTRAVGGEYLEALTGFIRSFDEGPAADPTIAQVDTTGQLRRLEELSEWAEAERHRVRRALADVG
jgi:hypothetical protein